MKELVNLETILISLTKSVMSQWKITRNKVFNTIQLKKNLSNFKKIMMIVSKT
jgi:hypothetical protein